MKLLIPPLAFAFVAFFCMFAPIAHPHVPFWPVMAFTALALSSFSLFFHKKTSDEIYAFNCPHFFVGIVSAFVLYAIFWIGHFLSTRIFPFAASQIGSIYSIRANQSPMIIACLLMFLIGPAEEIFWRGFVQHRLSKKYNTWVALIVATALYTSVHIASMNFMLICASALCGLFWGLLFIKTQRIWPCIISHAIWDVTIFILQPIN